MKELAPREISRKNKMLFEKLNAGDTSAMAEILINNMDIVEYQVKLISPLLKNSAVVSEEDLRQEAMIAMFKIIQKRPVYNQFRAYTTTAIQRSLETFVDIQNDAESADLYLDAPIAPALPRLKDVATDKSEYDKMLDREYANGSVNTQYLCADDRKFLNMISYATPQEIAKALDIPEHRLIAIHEDIKQSIIEQRPSLLGYRALIDYETKMIKTKKKFEPCILKTKHTAEVCDYMINNSSRVEEVAKHFNRTRQDIYVILDKMARRSRKVVREMQQSKDASSTLADWRF